MNKTTDWLSRLGELGRVYEVGGQVRDRLRGLAGESKDEDYLVTGIPLETLIGELRQFGRVDLVGKSFGVLKFTPRYPPNAAPRTHDIALPRKEYSTGVGHTDFAVEFDHTRPVEDDLLRRDFTINALARDVTSGEIVDPTGGAQDLSAGLIRQVNQRSFPEDPLRMLRAVQFAARFEFTIESLTREEITKHAALIETISAERIAEELNKLLLKARRPSTGFRLLQQLGILKYILPELNDCVGVEQPGGYHAYDVFEHAMHTVDEVRPSLQLRWAALLHDINKPQAKETDGIKATFYGHEKRGARTAANVLRRLRYSKDLIREVSLLVDRHMFTTEVTDKGMRRLIRRLGKELIFDLLDLRRADVVAQGMGGTTEDVDLLEQRIRDELSRRPPFGIGDLAVDGHDLMQHLQFGPGPRLGRILSYLLEQTLDDPRLNTVEHLLRLAESFKPDETS